MAITKIKASSKATKPKAKQPKAAPRKPKGKLAKFFRAIFKPFVALGRYVKLSWRELRQVRWPNRRQTWKMAISVVIYTAVFAAFIMLFDLLFTLLFNNVLG
jgi:preprotein translocase SecE subunit